MSEVNSYWYSRIPFPTHVVQNKEQNAKYYARYILNRLQQMFEYGGLPDSIPKRYMLLQLFTNGNIFVTDQTNNHGLMTFVGDWGGIPDGYYVPTKYVVANPYTKVDRTFDIGTDGILILNDSLSIGLLPMIMRYAELLAENDISLRIASINARRRNVISAPDADDRAYKSAEKYLSDVEEGRLGIVGENAFLEGVRVQSDGVVGGTGIVDLIELEQYLRATLYNELGLNANYNMKRESINSNESQLNKDALYPLIDNMLAEQTEGWSKVNEKYGTNISVKLSSSWADNEYEKELDLDILANDAESEDESVSSDQEEGDDDDGSQN